MTRLVIVAAMVFTLSGVSRAQEEAPVKCVITVYGFRHNDGFLMKSLRFDPALGEEEVTNKVVRVPNTRAFVVASVFPTDESMHSAGGADSLRIALAVSRQRLKHAFNIPNNAVAEATLMSFDTLRAEKNARIGNRDMRVRLECWNPRLEKSDNQ